MYAMHPCFFLRNLSHNLRCFGQLLIINEQNLRKSWKRGKTMRTIGEIITNGRKNKGLSQSNLADLLQKEGFSLTYKAISKWEKNDTEPSVTVFMTLCRILGIKNIYEVYYGVNPDDPLSSLSEEGKKKALDYINLLHMSGMYEKHECRIIPFTRIIDIYENAVSAGKGNLLADGPKETYRVPSDIVPKEASFGVLIRGNSMEPAYEDGQIAWVHHQETLENGEIGIFSLNGESYIKKLQDDTEGVFLVSLNPAYPKIQLKEADRLDTIGKVVGKCDKDTIKNY